MVRRHFLRVSFSGADFSCVVSCGWCIRHAVWTMSNGFNALSLWSAPVNASFTAAAYSVPAQLCQNPSIHPTTDESRSWAPFHSTTLSGLVIKSRLGGGLVFCLNVKLE